MPKKIWDDHQFAVNILSLIIDTNYCNNSIDVWGDHAYG